MEEGWILLKDKVGETSESMVVGIFRRVMGKQPTANVWKGELLEHIPHDAIVPRSEGQKPFNFRLVKDRAVALYCSEYDVAPLSYKEFLLLEAIQSQMTRFEVFIAEYKMEWGCGLKPGDPVYVSIPDPTVITNQRAAAAIRYVGGLPPDRGLMFGIEITDEQYRGHGTTDGTFRDERHFVCEDKCGLFVALDKLSMDPEGSTLETAPRGGQSYAKAVSHGPPASGQSYPLHSGPPPENTHARSQAIQRVTVHDDRPPRFKKEDRVVVFDKAGSRIHGTVRWVGNARIAQYHIVGIETDVAVSARNFEGAMPGMTHYFIAAKNHHLFMPEMGAILSEKEALGTSVVENTSILAREMGVSSRQLMASQEAVLKEAKQAKAAQELEQLKQAVPESQQKKSLQKQLVQQREEAPQLMQQLQQLQHMLDSAAAEKKSLQEQLVQQREEVTQTRQQVQQLQQGLDDVAAEKKSLQEELVQQKEETRQQVQQLQQRLDGAAAENHQLQQRLHDALAASEQYQQRLGSASAELQGLQDIEPWKVSRNKVEIWTEIGTGGWGSVSEGTLQVAIKQLQREILSPHYIDRLRREMRMLAQVRHPNLVQFIGVVLDEAALKLQEPPMIITELLDVNLRKAYERKLEFNKLSVFQDVARALNYLHERHDAIIHRDVSAPNVLLEALPNGMWKGKVSDLGSANLAKLAHTLAEGAIIYAAPETLPQLAHQAHDPRSPPLPQTTKIDVYSYGILLCEVVTSRFPDPAQYYDMLGQVQREWPFMYDLILSCTKYNPVERPTMSKVLTKLLQP